MTEYCGMCAILPPKLIHYGAVGLPVSSVHIKFCDESPMLVTFHPTRFNKERFASAAHQLSKDITSMMT